MVQSPSKLESFSLDGLLRLSVGIDTEAAYLDLVDVEFELGT
jgi:hypothetical protein